MGIFLAVLFSLVTFGGVWYDSSGLYIDIGSTVFYHQRLFVWWKGQLAHCGIWYIFQRRTGKYDEKKVCRAMGAFCTICGVMLCLLAYLGSQAEQGQMAEAQLLPFGIVFLVVLLAALAGVVRYIRKAGRK